MTDQTYEDYVLRSGEAKRDLEVVYNPIFKHLKTAFSIMFSSEDFSGADFKRLSDMRYYQGGYPSPNTPPKEHALARQVAAIITLEDCVEKREFVAFLGTMGISCEQKKPVSADYLVSKDDEKKLREAWEGAGIDKEIPTDRKEALKLMLDRAQNLQKEICEVSDSIRVNAAEEVEDKFKIRKPAFLKAVSLTAVKLRRGEGIMGEKLDAVVDSAENLIDAVQFLLKK